MPHSLRSLLNETGKGTGSIPQQSAIWKALMTCMAEALSTGKGVSIRNLLSITSVRTSSRDPSPGLKNHVFFLATSLTRSYGINYRKPGTGLLTPCLEVNVSKICVMTGLDKDQVVGGIKAFVTKMGEFMGSGDHVRIPFGNMGVLLCEKRFCSFKFTADGINAPNMIKSIMSQSDFDGRVADPLASFVDSFLVTKKKEDEAKARKKEDEEAKLRAEFEAKAAQAAAALRQSQQRDRRPTANPSPPSPIAQSPQTSTRGPDSSRQPRSLYSREPYNVLKDQFEEKMSSFPFPKFLIPDTKKHAKEPTDVVNKNMEIAYTRLEGTLVLGLERREKETVAAKELKERNFQDYLGRRDKEARLRREITEHLDEQSAFDRTRKIKEFKESKAGALMTKDFRAYPMAKPLDLYEEYNHKKNVRETLELQVFNKLEVSQHKMRTDLARERKRLDILHSNLRQERVDKLAAKFGDEKEVCGHWERQIAMTKKLADLA